MTSNSIQLLVFKVAPSSANCKWDFFRNYCSKEDYRKIRTNDRARTQELHSFAEFQPQAIGPSRKSFAPPIVLCTGHRCTGAGTFLLSANCMEITAQKEMAKGDRASDRAQTPDPCSIVELTEQVTSAHEHSLTLTFTE